MNRKLRFALLIITTPFVVLAGVATSARHVCQSIPISANAPVTIPFELVMRHIMVNVRINNSRPLSFVLDTGDKTGIADFDVAKELGLKLERQVPVVGAGSDTLTGSFVKEANWTLDGLEGFSQPVTFAVPLGKMAARFGHDFDGIIGSDFIKQFVVEVDYQNLVLKLHDKDKFTYAGTGEGIRIELSQQGDPYLNGVLTPSGGQPIKGKFVLDLGSSASLIVTSPVVTKYKLLGNGLKTIKAIGVAGAGGQSTGRIGRVTELQIGKFKISNPLTMFSEDRAGEMASHDFDGIIGQKIASKFKIFLDYSHNRIILEPNSTFAESMERASAGIVLTTEGKPHVRIRVFDVLENSPASEAGVQKDDIIVSVDDQAAAELTVTKITAIFERPSPHKLTIKRGEQTLQITLISRRLI